jgi:Flp pilus assembly pilin Flp
VTGHNRQEREWGVTIKEYALVLALVAVGLVAVLAILGVALSGVFQKVVDPMATPPAAEETSDWNDDFEDETLPGWDWNRADGWQQNNGQLVLSARGELRGFSGDPTWTDYVVRVRAILYQGDGYGVYFRADGEPGTANAYVFQYDPGYDRPHGSFLFRKVVGGAERTPFGRVRAPEAHQWYNTWHEIQIDVVGNSFTAYIDRQPVLQASDNSYPAGRVGLRAWDATVAGFDSLSVSLSEP